jgi:hypothetical protein
MHNDVVADPGIRDVSEMDFFNEFPETDAARP